jgi:UDP-N-acetylmuramoylalanine--D-glutamate ligase
MNMQEWKQEFAGKKILIWGFGREGQSSYRLIRSLLPEQLIDIADSPKTGREVLAKAHEQTVHTHIFYDTDIDITSYDMVLKSPGIVVPTGLSRENLTGQTQLFLKHYRSQVIGITGTKGKSTTSTLTACILSTKYRTHLVGNIGTPCFDIVPELKPEDLVSFEVSCHQLELCPYSPHVAVFLNLFEEHLDHYGTMAAYGAAKANVFLHQQKGDIAILNEHLTEWIPQADQPVLIGRDIRAEGTTLIIPNESLTVKDCRLIGEHNYWNLAVVYYIAHAIYGIDNETFLAAAARFQPLEHRLEDLGIHGGIRYIDDSISTIGQSCIQALTSLKNIDTVLVGGMDRGIEYRELEDYLAARTDVQVIFMYASGHRVHAEMTARGLQREGLHEVEDLEQAVALAKSLTRPGCSCLLSPAASSYDHFKNFEERGDVFERLACR